MEDILDRLRTAEDVLAKAEGLYNSTSETRQRHEFALSNLYTEMASLRGRPKSAPTIDASTTWHTGPRAWRKIEEDYEEAIRFCSLAAHSRAENTHQVDVRYWVTRNRLDNEPTESPRRLELTADLCEIMEEEVWRNQPEQYQKRMVDLGGSWATKSVNERGGSTARQYGINGGTLPPSPPFGLRSGSPFPQPGFPDAGAGVPGRNRSASTRRFRILRLYCRTWWQTYGNPNLFGEAVIARRPHCRLISGATTWAF